LARADAGPTPQQVAAAKISVKVSKKLGETPAPWLITLSESDSRTTHFKRGLEDGRASVKRSDD
jgi:hypothetical protein